MDVIKYNRLAWDKETEKGNQWTVPVSSEEIARAKKGDWQIVLTPLKPVPKEWFGDLGGASVLCLASGGGQQGPILAAAGAKVTVFDNSPKQLEADEMVAKRDELDVTTVQGDMKDLSVFEDETFDLIVHPVSNCFCDDILPVWKECYRVLKPGGALISGICNPVMFIFDLEKDEQGILEVKYSLPYSDIDCPDEAARQMILDRGNPLEYSHTLETQIGGQTDAGFVIAGFYEDDFGGRYPLEKYMKPFFATRAVKL